MFQMQDFAAPAPKQSMRRRDKKKAPWSPEEDAELRRWVATRYGESYVDSSIIEWSQAASEIFHNRSTKQIRERWCNVLDPSIKRDEWAEHELRILFEAQQELGNKWSEIAKRLPGRPEAAVKNTFYSSQRRARRRLQRFGETRTPNLTEIAVEAIEACKTAQALKHRREQARMRAGSDEEEEALDGKRKGGKKRWRRSDGIGGAGGLGTSARGRKRGRDAGALGDVGLGLGPLGDLTGSGLEGLPLDPTMRMAGLPGMNMNVFGGAGGLAGLPGAGIMPSLGGMGMMLPGLNTGSFSAGLPVSGGLPVIPGMGLPPTTDVMTSLEVGATPAGAGPRPANVNLPATAANLLSPLAAAAFAHSSSPAVLHPEDTVLMLCRYHPGTHSAIPLQWDSEAPASMDAVAATAAMVPPTAPVDLPAGLNMPQPTGLPAFADLVAQDTPQTATAAPPAPAPAPEPAAPAPEVPEAVEAPPAALEAVAVPPAIKGRVDEKTDVANLLASLGNGWIDDKGTPTPAGTSAGTTTTAAEAAATTTTTDAAVASITGVPAAPEQAPLPSLDVPEVQDGAESAAKKPRTDEGTAQ